MSSPLNDQCDVCRKLIRSKTKHDCPHRQCALVATDQCENSQDHEQLLTQLKQQEKAIEMLDKELEQLTQFEQFRKQIPDRTRKSFHFYF